MQAGCWKSDRDLGIVGLRAMLAFRDPGDLTARLKRKFLVSMDEL